MFIQTESTPNPATLKFLPGRDVLGENQVADFPDLESSGNSPLAQRLFEVDEVVAVFLGSDFITITKSHGEWAHMKPAILGVIMDHFTTGQPVMISAVADVAAEPAGDDSEIVLQIKELLDTRVRPAVAQDGGDIVFSSFDEQSGVVRLHMRGACAGCPSSTMTLQHGIQNLLRHFIPEVTEVRAADDMVA